MSSAGEIIYKGFAPTLKMGIGIGVGYAITKAGLFPPICAKGLSIVALNISLPALIFASMVPSFNSTNISAFGGLALAALMYQAIGAIMGWIVKELFFVPLDFQWGIIVMGMFSNWANVPIAVVQTVGNNAPFKEGDVDAGIAYISVFSLIFVVILFPCGVHKICALDFKEENLNRGLPPPFKERWAERIEWIKEKTHTLRSRKRVLGKKSIEDPETPYTTTITASEKDEKTNDLNQDHDHDHHHHHGEIGEEPGALRSRSSGYLGGAIPTRKTSRTPSFTSMLESTKPIPPTLPHDTVDLNKTQPQPTEPTSSNGTSSGSNNTLLPISSNNGKAYSFHEPPTPVPSIQKRSLKSRLVSGSKSFLMPVTIAVIISIPCALVVPLKALFIPVDGYTRIPNGPDGKPPLYFIFETAVFMGGICIPGGLILLGASFARLKGAMGFKGQPIGAMVAMAVVKMIIMPIIGVFFVLNSPNIYPPEDRMRVFVCILLSGTPAAVNQLVVTQLYNSEGTAHTLARFLLLQYMLMPVLSTILAAVALYVCQR